MQGITSILDRTLSKNVDLSPIFTDELFGTVEVHESSERKEYNDTKAVHDSVDALEKYKNVIEQPHYPSEENLQKSGKVLRNAAIDRRVMYNKKKKANATEPITTKPSDMPVNFQSKRTVPKRDRVHRKIPLDSEITGLNENDGNTIRRVRQILRDRIVGEINKDMSKRNIKISAEGIVRQLQIR